MRIYRALGTQTQDLLSAQLQFLFLSEIIGGLRLIAALAVTLPTRSIWFQDADNATLHWDWNPVRRPKAVTGHGSAGRRPSLACTGHGSAGRRPALACTGAGRRPALACTGGTSECRAAGRRPALAGPKARHCGARSVRAAQ